LQAQTENKVPNQYMIYFADGTTQAEVIEVANEWNSTVLVNIQPNLTNVALYKFNGTFPFTNPYNSSESVNSLIEVVGKIKKHKPKADGGGLNYTFEGNSPSIINGNCYDESLLKDETGNASTVRVAVFDTGTNWDSANLNGFNFGTPHEINGDATDKNGHGTHVASIVNKTYLESNNGSTTTSVQYVFGNPLGADGQGTLADMVFSMEEAINHNANVINLSVSYWGATMQFGVPESPGGLGGPETPIHPGEEDVLYLLMSSADPTSTLFVVAAGNNYGVDLDATAELSVYPAAFPLENMITVASHSCLNGLSDFSNFGAESVDLAAPGENIVSIDHEMDLVAYSGTSQSTAYVSGAASILGTHLPVFDAAKVKCAILNSAKYMPGLDGKLVTNGILNIPEAVNLVNNNCGSNASLGGQLIQPKIGQNVKITPTVFSSDVNIAFDLESDGPVDISIYALDGQMIFSTNHLGIKGNNEILVNLERLPNRSTMLIRIETNEFTKTSKIIKVQ